ncbi:MULTISPECIES: bifunctional DNA-formamidopyrimidine glycosylase/DNA-(apurinic or apyrimidinic site) lyase [Actinoalloteichus]|uniref:Formamidopyrimidine-DNA glycosylase n=1 Tax=Actinoalloteichus fjordicus TaxID=1612552 RepID=A0AAC9LHS5_9PSEU|nr:MULTISPECIES: bifunctional DNA-formamidopyrimidine glycosylase/DNA-(apurinic or apyrimidinic site) lyase [Actinoalloteichus]APU17124.1 DNA-(apurinic or apyrimidinic site) lyase [Actinoalloteichus fjordicus]APU23206.1 DNA-(apurinic or apyrimidinic site) lyase [Actinoalloteichus sp. GBA129-24]
MPELPEVEVVRLGLLDHAVGRTIADVEVLHPRAVRRHEPGPADFVARLRGARLTAANRRGKYLWLELTGAVAAASEFVGASLAAEDETDGSNGVVGAQADPESGRGHDVVRPPSPSAVEGAALLVHLGMSGQLLVKDSAAPDERHLRVRFRFADGGELRFVDQRTFGGLTLADLLEVDGTTLPVPVAHIGRDPLDPRFDAAAVVEAMRRRRTGVKRALLDQTLVSGVGNIYADEALWRTRLHWARPTASLPAAKAAELVNAAADVMREALGQGGTSFDALYVNVNGQSGYFDRSLAVYGQEGLPCPRCASPVRRDPFMNRSAFSCPGCQPEPADAHR